MRCFQLMVLALLCLTLPAVAFEGPSQEIGKALFNSTTLGSNHKSCQQCHPNGKGLQEIGAYNDGQLREMINFCIRDALKGKMLDPDSQEISSLLLYVRSLAPAEENPGSN